MTLDWLTKNSAMTHGASPDPTLRTRLYPQPVKVINTAVVVAGGLLRGWKNISETSTGPAWSYFIYQRKSKFAKFVDDIEITIASHPHGSTVEARSSSRTGKGDLGQNRRNILDFYEALGIVLMDVKPLSGQRGQLFYHYTPNSIERVAKLFFNPLMLPVISPPKPKIKIVSVPDQLEVGSKMSLKLDGLIDWTFEFTEWNPPNSFTIRQINGPFSEFIHRHTFAPAGNGCIVSDRVHYKNRFGAIGDILAGSSLVGAKLVEMFAERAQNLDNYLASNR